MTTELSDWMQVIDEAEIASPALLVYPDRIEENLRRMVALAGGAERLRPHVKTHKLPQIIKLKLAHGIHKFKVATIAEAEMCATAGGLDVLVAYPMVGPNIGRFVQLIKTYPNTVFSCLADDASNIHDLDTAAKQADVVLNVFLDLNVGMNRTGVEPGPRADALFRQISLAENLCPAGIHAYDGHLRGAVATKLVNEVTAAFAPVWKLRAELISAGFPVDKVIAAGTPTFPIHAQNRDVELSPGTTVLWDRGISDECSGMEFLHAAVLLTRVISRPTHDHLCIDLGHKALASEMPPPRVNLFGLEDAKFVSHSEEHMVLETSRAHEFPVGTVLYGITRHVCPTVALQSEVLVVRHGRVVDNWPIPARQRRITI